MCFNSKAIIIYHRIFFIFIFYKTALSYAWFAVMQLLLPSVFVLYYVVKDMIHMIFSQNIPVQTNLLFCIRTPCPHFFFTILNAINNKMPQKCISYRHYLCFVYN